MRRPQNLSNTEYLDWVLENELYPIPSDPVNDCWFPHRRPVDSYGRPKSYWKGKVRKMYHNTYMALHELEESPFSSKLHASHTCNNHNCVNPHHIVEETPAENEARKKDLPGMDLWKKSLQEHQEKVKAGIIPKMPRGLSLKETANWLLENKTWEDTDSQKINGSHCLRWKGQQMGKGYGQHNITVAKGTRKKIQVHRFTHCILNDLPYSGNPDEPWGSCVEAGLVADHMCNTPNCVNPDHIQLISRTENNIRAISYAKSTKITEEDAREIIKDFMSVTEWPLGSKTEFKKKWAEKLGVSTDVAGNIVFRKIRWKHLLKEYGLL